MSSSRRRTTRVQPTASPSQPEIPSRRVESSGRPAGETRSEDPNRSFLVNEESNLNPPESLSGLSVDGTEESTATSSVHEKTFQFLFGLIIAAKL